MVCESTGVKHFFVVVSLALMYLVICLRASLSFSRQIATARSTLSLLPQVRTHSNAHRRSTMTTTMSQATMVPAHDATTTQAANAAGEEGIALDATDAGQLDTNENLASQEEEESPWVDEDDDDDEEGGGGEAPKESPGVSEAAAAAPDPAAATTTTSARTKPRKEAKTKPAGILKKTVAAPAPPPPPKDVVKGWLHKTPQQRLKEANKAKAAQQAVAAKQQALAHAATVAAALQAAQVQLQPRIIAPIKVKTQPKTTTAVVPPPRSPEKKKRAAPVAAASPKIQRKRPKVAPKVVDPVVVPKAVVSPTSEVVDPLASVPEVATVDPLPAATTSDAATTEAPATENAVAAAEPSTPTAVVKKVKKVIKVIKPAVSKVKKTVTAKPAEKPVKKAAKPKDKAVKKAAKPKAVKKAVKPADQGAAARTSAILVEELVADDAGLRPQGWPVVVLSDKTLNWRKKVYERASGATKGGRDRYWYSPCRQHKFRSLVEIRRYLDILESFPPPTVATEETVGELELQAWQQFKKK
jgi:Methyl-CpG binding domain